MCACSEVRADVVAFWYNDGASLALVDPDESVRCRSIDGGGRGDAHAIPWRIRKPAADA